MRDTPQDSTGFTPFELIYGRSVRTPMTLLRKLWTEEEEDTEVKTAYQYVIDLRERLEETCTLAQQELSKVQGRNQQYYNRHAKKRVLSLGNSLLLLLPTEHNKLTLAWRGPYKIVGNVGDVDYRVEVESEKMKTYRITMLKRYYHRNEKEPDFSGQVRGNTVPQPDVTNSDQDGECTVEHAAPIACVIEDNSHDDDEGATVKDADLLPLYSAQQKETVDDVDINPRLSQAQTNELKQLLYEYRQIFSDVPTVTHLVEHKVELTQTEPVTCKPYPTPYKMQELSTEK